MLQSAWLQQRSHCAALHTLPSRPHTQAGHEAYFRGRFGAALLAYLRAADLGVEVAQSNAAWMLERGYAVAPSEYAITKSMNM